MINMNIRKQLDELIKFDDEVSEEELAHMDERDTKIINKIFALAEELHRNLGQYGDLVEHRLPESSQYELLGLLQNLLDDKTEGPSWSGD
jgi:hypothetical protein